MANADKSLGLRAFLQANPVSTPEQRQELIKGYYLNYGQRNGGNSMFPGGLVPGAPMMLQEFVRNPGPAGYEKHGTITDKKQNVRYTIEDVETIAGQDGVPEPSKINYVAEDGTRMSWDLTTNNMGINPVVKEDWGKPNPKTGNPRVPLNFYDMQQGTDRNPFKHPIKYVSELLMGPNEDTVSDQTLPFSSKWTPEENKSFQQTGRIPTGRDARDLNGSGYQPWVNKSTLNPSESPTIKNNGVIDTIWGSNLNPIGLAHRALNAPADTVHNGAPIPGLGTIADILTNITHSDDWENLGSNSPSETKPAYTTNKAGQGYQTQPESHSLLTAIKGSPNDGTAVGVGKGLANVPIAAGQMVGGLGDFLTSPLGAATIASSGLAAPAAAGAVSGIEGLAAARAAVAAAATPAELAAAQTALTTAANASRAANVISGVNQALQVPLQGKFALDMGTGAWDAGKNAYNEITGQVPVYNKAGAGYENRGTANWPAALHEGANAAMNAAFAGQIGAHTLGAAGNAINPGKMAIDGAVQNALTLPPQTQFNQKGYDIGDFLGLNTKLSGGFYQATDPWADVSINLDPNYRVSNDPNAATTPVMPVRRPEDVTTGQDPEAYKRARTILATQQSPASQPAQVLAPETIADVVKKAAEPKLKLSPEQENARLRTPIGQGEGKIDPEYQRMRGVAEIIGNERVDMANLVAGPGVGRSRRVEVDPKAAAEAAQRASLGLKPGEPLPQGIPGSASADKSAAELAASTGPVLTGPEAAKPVITDREYDVINAVRLGTDFLNDSDRTAVLEGEAVIDPRNVDVPEFAAAKAQGLIEPFKKANGVQYWKYTEKGLGLLEQQMEMDGYEINWKGKESEPAPTAPAAAVDAPATAEKVVMAIDIVKALPALPEYKNVLTKQLNDIYMDNGRPKNPTKISKSEMARGKAIREKLEEIAKKEPAADTATASEPVAAAAPVSVADVVAPAEPVKKPKVKPAAPLEPVVEPAKAPVTEPVTAGAAPLIDTTPPQPKVNVSGPTARGGPDAPRQRGERGVRTGPWMPDAAAQAAAPQTRTPTPSGPNRVRTLAKPQFSARGIPILSAKQMFEKNEGKLNRLTYSHLKDLYEETVADPAHNPQFAARIKDEMSNRENRFKDTYSTEQEGRNLISGDPVETMTDAQLKDVVDNGQERIKKQREIVAGHNRGDYRSPLRERSQEGKDALRELNRLEYQWKFAKQEQNKRVRVNAGIARPDGSRIVASKERQMTQMRVDPLTGEEKAVPTEKRKPVEALNHSRGRFDKLTLDELVAAEAELRNQGRGYADKVKDAIQARLKEGDAVHRRLHGKDADNIPNPRTATRDQLEARIPDLKKDITRLEGEVAEQRKAGKVDPQTEKSLAEARGDLSGFEKELAARDAMETTDIRYEANKNNFKQTSGDIQGTGTLPKGNGYKPQPKAPAQDKAPPIEGRDKDVIRNEGAAAYEAEQRDAASRANPNPLGLEGEGRNSSKSQLSPAELKLVERLKNRDTPQKYQPGAWDRQGKSKLDDAREDLQRATERFKEADAAVKASEAARGWVPTELVSVSVDTHKRMQRAKERLNALGESPNSIGLEGEGRNASRSANRGTINLDETTRQANKAARDRFVANEAVYMKLSESQRRLADTIAKGGATVGDILKQVVEEAKRDKGLTSNMTKMADLLLKNSDAKSLSKLVEMNRDQFLQESYYSGSSISGLGKLTGDRSPRSLQGHVSLSQLHLSDPKDLMRVVMHEFIHATTADKINRAIFGNSTMGSFKTDVFGQSGQKYLDRLRAFVRDPDADKGVVKVAQAYLKYLSTLEAKGELDTKPITAESLESARNAETGEAWKSNLVGQGISTGNHLAHGQYKASNLHEFMAAITEPEFQETLKGIKMGNSTAWGKMKDAIAEIMGITPSDSALRHTFDGVMEISRKDLSEFKRGDINSQGMNLAQVRAERFMSEGMSKEDAMRRAIQEIRPDMEDAFGFGKQNDSSLQTAADIRADREANAAEERAKANSPDMRGYWDRQDKDAALGSRLNEVESDTLKNTQEHPLYEEALRNVEDNNIGEKRDAIDTNDAVAAEIRRLEGIDSGNYDAKQTSADRKRFYEKSRRSEQSLGEELRSSRDAWEVKAGYHQTKGTFERFQKDWDAQPDEFKAQVDYEAMTANDSFQERLASSDNPEGVKADLRQAIAEHYNIDPSRMLDTKDNPMLLGDKDTEAPNKDITGPMTEEDWNGFEEQNYGSKRDNSYPNSDPRDPTLRRRFTDNKTDKGEAVGDFFERPRYAGYPGTFAGRDRVRNARQVAQGLPDWAGDAERAKEKEARTAREKERMGDMGSDNAFGLEGEGRNSSKIGDFTRRETQASINRAKETVEVLKKFAPSSKLELGQKAVDVVTLSALNSGQAHLDKLAERHNIPAIREINDLLMGGRAGDMTRAVKNGFHSKVKSENNRLNNKLNNALRPLEKRLEELPSAGQAKLLEEVGRAVVSKTPHPDAEIAAAADAVRLVYRDMYHMQKNAGIELGNSGPNYIPRMLNHEIVLKDRQKFVNAAAKAYETTGLDPADAMDAANDWWYSIQRGDEGFSYDGNFVFDAAAHNGEPKHTRGRIFNDIAEGHMEPFYNRNVIDATRQYIGRAVKATQLAERFGPDFGRYRDIQQRIIDSGPKGEGLLRQVNETVKGQLAPQKIGNSVLRGAHDAAAVYQSVRFLSRAVISSLGEPIVGAMRTGQVADAAVMMFDSVKQAYRQARHIDPDYHTKLAEEIGAIQSILSDSAVTSSVDSRMIDTVSSGLSKKVQSQFFRTTGLHQWTEGTRVASIKLGERFIRRLALDIDAGGRSKELSARYLTELGIDPKDHASFSKFIKQLEGMDQQTRLKAITSPRGRHSAAYRDALIRFGEQVIMDPNRGTRARLANHPVGNLIFGLQSYLYAFNENVVKRTLKTTGAAVFNSDNNNMSASNRMMLLAPLAIAPVFAAFQYGQGEFRDEYMSDPSRADDEPMSNGTKFMRMMSRSAFLGRHDFVANLFGSFKYDKDPATAVAGPVLGDISTFLKNQIGLYKDSNSPNTNTAERRAARSGFDSGVAPAAGLFASQLPGVTGRLIGAGITYAANHPATREWAVEQVAGPAVQKKKQTQKQKDAKKNFVDLLWEDQK
jgi:hypothetical protein